jgi:putative nucleotidyltransferase with HDIG domain
MSGPIAERLAASPAVRAARAATGEREDAWVVGGAVRDAALDRDVVDVDLAVGDEEGRLAIAVARAAGGHAFELSQEFRTWRATVPSAGWHVDVTALRRPTIEDDLALRDFTVNALAVPLARLDEPPLDPTGGVADLQARRLRATSRRSFADDPLRILRAARLAAELDLRIDAGTMELARADAERASEPAGERQLAELRRLIAGPDPVRGLELLDALGGTRGVLPELEALKGVEQNPYHHLDVHGHTLDVLRQLLTVEADLAAYAGAERTGEVEEALREPLADELDRRAALRLAALVHDFGKPATRRVEPSGRILFIGHDQAGARIARQVCSRLRASRRLSDYLASLTLNHLRLGFLVHRRPLTPGDVYEYLRATDPWSLDVTLLTVADRLATQGERTRAEAIDAHLELARRMIQEALDWRREGPPRSPIPGDELAAELGIEPGPELGRMLARIEEAVFAGEVRTPEDAVAHARKLRFD